MMDLLHFIMVIDFLRILLNFAFSIFWGEMLWDADEQVFKLGFWFFLFILRNL